MNVIKNIHKFNKEKNELVAKNSVLLDKINTYKKRILFYQTMKKYLLTTHNFTFDIQDDIDEIMYNLFIPNVVRKKIIIIDSEIKNLTSSVNSFENIYDNTEIKIDTLFGLINNSVSDLECNCEHFNKISEILQIIRLPIRKHNIFYHPIFKNFIENNKNNEPVNIILIQELLKFNRNQIIDYIFENKSLFTLSYNILVNLIN